MALSMHLDKWQTDVTQASLDRSSTSLLTSRTHPSAALAKDWLRSRLPQSSPSCSHSTFGITQSTRQACTLNVHGKLAHHCALAFALAVSPPATRCEEVLQASWELCSASADYGDDALAGALLSLDK